MEAPFLPHFLTRIPLVFCDVVDLYGIKNCVVLGKTTEDCYVLVVFREDGCVVASGGLEGRLVDPPAFLVVEELDLTQKSFGCVTADGKYASWGCNYCKIDSAPFHGF